MISSLRVRTHSQNRTVAARAMAERKTLGTCRSGCDAPPVLEATEHDLDAVAAFIPALVVFNGFVAGFSARNAGANPLFLQRIAEPVGVIAPIAQQPLCFGQSILQQRRCGVIADLPCRHEEADRTPFGIRHSV